MRVSIFGLGYVGCVTGACLAKAGHDVVGVDVNAEKVALVNSASSPLVEPGLGELLADVVPARRFRATSSTEEAVAGSDLALICVGTPGRTSGQLDVRAVEQVGHDIGRALRGRIRPYSVVCRSTVLPGTTEQILLPAIRAGAQDAATVVRAAFNPEFMREGTSLRDFGRPPFTVVGCESPDAVQQLRELYASVDAPFVHTGVRTAELLKYAANAFHALKVCFANEIGDVCAAFGIDPHELMRLFGMDRKLNISEAYLRPGFAFGGSCLPKDVRALVYAARTLDVSVPVLSAALPSNEGQVRRAVQAVLETRRRRVGVVGLAFKSGTDDLRESPMVALVETLIGKGCDVRILDGNVALARLMGANRRYIEEEIPHIASLMCDSVDALVAHAEVVVIGNPGPEAMDALTAVGPDHLVVDLTRGAVRRNAPRGSGTELLSPSDLRSPARAAA